MNKIVRQDEDLRYKLILREAYTNCGDDSLKKLEYIKEKGTSQQYIMALLDEAQRKASIAGVGENKIEEFKYGTYNIDCTFRAFLDAVRHMQTDLPDGVYKFILSNMEWFALKTIEQVDACKKEIK